MQKLFFFYFAFKYPVNCIQDGLFGATRGWGPLLLKICHTYPTMMKIGSFTLPEEDPKNIAVTWHASWVVHTSTLFHRKSTNFAITANTDIQILFWYIIFNPFNFSWVFKYCFNKHGYNCDDVSKNSYSSPS